MRLFVGLRESVEAGSVLLPNSDLEVSGNRGPLIRGSSLSRQWYSPGLCITGGTIIPRGANCVRAARRHPWRGGQNYRRLDATGCSAEALLDDFGIKPRWFEDTGASLYDWRADMPISGVTL